MVFPLARGARGVRVDPAFPSVQAPLWPSSSNISQTFYIVIAFGFFLALCRWLRLRGVTAGETAFAWAAGINILLGIMDALSLESLLVWVRTASYALNDEQTMAGFSRIIGGFAEPASFGSASVVFCGYFLSAWGHSGRWRDALLGLFNGLFAILTFSSTGFGALAVVVVLLAGQEIGRLKAGRSRVAGTAGVGVFFAVLALGVVVVALSPLLETALVLLDQLFLTKLDSLSGRERSAWAASGIETFVQTWGLGAGPGSLRSNGLVPVLLGNVGLPGLLAFLAFLIFTIGQSAARINDPDASRIHGAARIAALAQLTSMMLSATVPDPTLMLVVCCGLAAIAREQGNATNAVIVAEANNQDPLNAL